MERRFEMAEDSEQVKMIGGNQKATSKHLLLLWPELLPRATLKKAVIK